MPKRTLGHLVLTFDQAAQQYARAFRTYVLEPLPTQVQHDAMIDAARVWSAARAEYLAELDRKGMADQATDLLLAVLETTGSPRVRP